MEQGYASHLVGLVVTVAVGVLMITPTDELQNGAASAGLLFIRAASLLLAHDTDDVRSLTKSLASLIILPTIFPRISRSSSCSLALVRPARVERASTKEF